VSRGYYLTNNKAVQTCKLVTGQSEKFAFPSRNLSLPSCITRFFLVGQMIWLSKVWQLWLTWNVLLTPVTCRRKNVGRIAYTTFSNEFHLPCHQLEIYRFIIIRGLWLGLWRLLMLSYIDYLILVRRFDINLNNLSNKVIKEITRLSWKIIGLRFYRQFDKIATRKIVCHTFLQT